MAMIKRSDIRFGQLRAFLEGLGFSATRGKQGWRLVHGPSETILIFRPYRRTERVFLPDLFALRWQLDGHGLLPQAEFDESLTKAPA